MFIYYFAVNNKVYCIRIIEHLNFSTMPKIKLSSESSKSIGQKLKNQRLALGLSQQQVADRNEMSAVAYSKMEAGQTNFNWARLEQLAKFYGINAPDLVDRSVRIPRPADTCKHPADYEKIIRDKESLIRVLKERIEHLERLIVYSTDK